MRRSHPTATRGGNDEGEETDRGRLAGAVRPQQREELAPFDLERDPIHSVAVGALVPLDEAIHHDNRVHQDGLVAARGSGGIR